MQYAVRQFRPDEARQYRDMRLEALKLEPGCFGNAFEVEAAWPVAVWLERLEDPLRASFGLFEGDDLVGLTSIVCTADKPGEGYLTQSYIRKAHRGKGLSSMLYDARIAWAKKAALQWLIVGHRASNHASSAANQRYGFRYSHREPRRWPDGKEEDMLYYRLHVDDAAVRSAEATGSTSPTQQPPDSTPVSMDMKTPPFIIRTATPEDAPALKAIGLAAYGEYADAMLPEHWATMRAGLDSDANIAQLLEKATCFVCEHNGCPVGAIYLVPRGNPTAYFQEDWAYIRMLGVLPEYRGSGIGRALTTQCIHHARQTGEQTIALHTSEFQQTARLMYERMGFRRQREIGPLHGARYWVYSRPL